MITSAFNNNQTVGRKTIDGIEVVYIKNMYDNYMSSGRKIYSFLNFIRLAIKEASKEKGVNVVFATSTPLTVGYIALRLKAKKEWPFIFEVRDLWPEFPIEIGAIRNGMVIRLLRRLEKRIYDKSEHVVALSPGMKDGVIKAGTPEGKVSVIPNMSKPDKFFPHEPNLEVVNKFALDLNKFNVIHFGSMGRANGLNYIIEAARCLKDMGDDSIRFLFMGSGATEPVIKKQAEDYNLKNIQFLGNHKMDVVAEVVNCCDASITTFMNLPVLKTNSPNKLFDSLSAGKPIIVNSSGWTKDLVEKERCGFYAEPNNPEELAKKLLFYKEDKETLEMWQKNARRLSLEVFNKDLLSAQVADVIEKYGKSKNNV